MYSILLASHSLLRWAVLFSLVLAISRALWKLLRKLKYLNIDNKIRHWTTTIAHIQLMLGTLVYGNSTIVAHFFSAPKKGMQQIELSFFSIYHLLLMLTAIVMITIGSAKAKRKGSDEQKFKTIIFWYLLGLLVILIAIPWPFSPFVTRPYIRPF